MVLHLVQLLLLGLEHGHGRLGNWPDRLLARRLLDYLSLIRLLYWIIDPFISVSALISLDLHDLLLDLVEAHQFVELVRDLVEDFQLILEQTCLLQMADEVYRGRNHMLVVLFRHSSSINVQRFLVGTVFHELFAGRLLVLLVALSWSGASSSLVQSCSRADSGVLHLFLVLLLQVILDIRVGLREFLKELGHVADSF